MPRLRARLRDIVSNGDADALPEVLAAIRATGGLDYSRARAGGIRDARRSRADGTGRQCNVAALRGLARYAVSRDD